jgi:pyruvate,water dikinase
VSWWSNLFGRRTGNESITLLRLRTTRFRQLLGSHGSFLALLEDAAEKQGGAFILDMQYVIALAEQLAELGDAIVFDLNVISAQGHLAFYDVAEWLRAQLRGLVAQGAGGPAKAGSEAPAAPGPAAVSPTALAAALGRSRVLYAQRGHVACRGVASGEVRNLPDGADLGGVSDGTVLVAGDITAQDAVLVGAARRACAILLDRGSAAGTAARLARELRIPAIVGLKDATSRVPSGTEVTVDADENVVYQGRIPELLDYYRSARSGADEEEEYRLLRLVRQSAFPLSFVADQAEPALPGCRTLHDLVHLSRSLAGDALHELLASEPPEAGAPVRLPHAPWCEVLLFDLQGPPGRSREDVTVSELRSSPLRALLEGLTGPSGWRDRPPTLGPWALRAAVNDEHALAVATAPRGFDMLDATVGGGRATDAVYCRFSPRGEEDPGASRGALAAGVLTRLGFAVARTSREVSGWIRGLPSAETEERIRIIGALSAHLAQLGAAGWRRAPVESNVETFLRGCA